MEQEIVKVAISQGLGYTLFVFLLIYVLKTTQERENRLNATIDKNQSNNTRFSNKIKCY